MKNKSIAYRFSKTISKMLLLFFLGVVGITLVIELIRIKGLERKELQIEADNILEIVELRFQSLVDAVRRTTTSSLSINSLIDFNMSSSYFKYALKDLTFDTDIEQAVVFDYSGNLVVPSSEEDLQWFSRNLISSTISLGRGHILFNEGYFYIVEPIIYYDTTQGGIIAKVSIEDLVQKSITEKVSFYTVSVVDSWEKSTFPMGFSEGRQTAISSEDSLLADYSPTLTVAKETSYLLNRITPWLTSISILGTVGVLAMMLFSRRIARNMAEPIVVMTNQVNAGMYPVSPTNTDDELEVLAKAFDKATFELNKVNAEKIEAEKRDGESQVRAIVNTVTDGIITINCEGVVETFNPAAEKIFCYKASEVIGNNVKMLMPDSYREKFDSYVAEYLHTDCVSLLGIGRDVTAQCKNASMIPVELTVSKMVVAGRTLFTGIVRDIRERKETERMKNEFISTVSHELRTPLTSIRGALGIVLGKGENSLPDKIGKMIEVAHRNSERLTLLINDILDIEKLDSGQLDLDFTTMNLIPLMCRSIEDNEGFANKHNVELEYKTVLKSALVRADENRLLQVLANLVSNAIKFSPEKQAVRILLEKNGDFFRVSVRDNGSGISPNFRKRIFQRFAQADGSDTREKGGTGLGLSITKAIVEQHGGKIDYESQIDQGTTFFFDLPMITGGVLSASD